MRFVLDASALINNPGFSFAAGSIVYLTTEPVFREWKDFRTRLTAEHGLKAARLLIREPRPSSIDRVRETARRLGTVGLSGADESVLALAFDNNGWEPTTLITDDYRIQNVARALRIKVEGAMMEGIREVRKFRGPGSMADSPLPASPSPPVSQKPKTALSAKPPESPDGDLDLDEITN